MAIEVVPYTPDRQTAVIAFNRRMREGGTRWGWYEHAVDSWLPRRPGVKVWREHYLALEDGQEVRGAYALKPQEWWLRGEPTVVTDWQGPVSEGLLSRRYNTLGLRLLRDMLKRYPLLYSWGHGGDEERMFQMLRSLKWLLHPTPFCLWVEHPFRFLRRNRYLRGSARNRAALDALAFSGAGWLGLKALHGALSLRGRVPAASGEVVADFGPWADALWERCRGAYAALGLRDAATLNALLPRDGWPESIRIRVRREGRDIGWVAVMDRALEHDARFGSLRVGTVIDALALPEDASAVVGVAKRFLRERGVDIICSNQSHPAWVQGFARSGFVVLPARRYFAASPALQAALEPFDETARGLHLTNLDGHGPHGF